MKEEEEEREDGKKKQKRKEGSLMEDLGTVHIKRVGFRTMMYKKRNGRRKRWEGKRDN